MKALTLLLTLPCLLLASCSRNPEDVVNPHDSKFERVAVAGDNCVLDTQTGLLWQIKTPEPGLNSAANTYSWYSPNEAHGELDYRGRENGGECTDSLCDTWHYVEAVNAVGICGHSDWRVPNKDELYSISDILRANSPPTINTDFFVDAEAAEYWSANDYSFQWDAAWAWNFELGHDRVDWKKSAKFVRLVRGTAGELDSVKE